MKPLAIAVWGFFVLIARHSWGASRVDITVRMGLTVQSMTFCDETGYQPKRYRPVVSEEDAWERAAEIMARALVEAWEEGRLPAQEQVLVMGPPESPILCDAA
jgi:hypothetical protein